jgi:hypothetical protein
LKTSYLFHSRHNTASLIRNITTESEHIAVSMKFVMVLPTEMFVVIGLLVVNVGGARKGRGSCASERCRLDAARRPTPRRARPPTYSLGIDSGGLYFLSR